METLPSGSLENLGQKKLQDNHQNAGSSLLDNAKKPSLMFWHQDEHTRLHISAPPVPRSSIANGGPKRVDVKKLRLRKDGRRGSFSSTSSCGQQSGRLNQEEELQPASPSPDLFLRKRRYPEVVGCAVKLELGVSEAMKCSSSLVKLLQQPIAGTFYSCSLEAQLVHESQQRASMEDGDEKVALRQDNEDETLKNLKVMTSLKHVTSSYEGVMDDPMEIEDDEDFVKRKKDEENNYIHGGGFASPIFKLRKPLEEATPNVKRTGNKETSLVVVEQEQEEEGKKEETKKKVSPSSNNSKKRAAPSSPEVIQQDDAAKKCKVTTIVEQTVKEVILVSDDDDHDDANQEKHEKQEEEAKDVIVKEEEEAQVISSDEEEDEVNEIPATPVHEEDDDEGEEKEITEEAEAKCVNIEETRENVDIVVHNAENKDDDETIKEQDNINTSKRETAIAIEKEKEKEGENVQQVEEESKEETNSSETKQVEKEDQKEREENHEDRQVLAMLDTENAELKLETKIIRDKLETTVMENEELKNQLSTLNNTIAELQKAVGNLQQEKTQNVEKLFNSMKGLQERIESLCHENSSKVAEAEQLRLNIQDLSTKLHESEKNHEIARVQAEEMRNVARLKQDDHDRVVSMAKMMSNQLSGAENENYRLRSQLQDESNKRTHLEDQSVEIRRMCQIFAETETQRWEQSVSTILDKFDQSLKAIEEKKVLVLDTIKAQAAQPRSSKCIVCCSNPTAVCYVPCGHRSVCPECDPRIEFCPVCRGFIRERIRTFDAGI